jgi:hypothetical protein
MGLHPHARWQPILDVVPIGHLQRPFSCRIFALSHGLADGGDISTNSLGSCCEWGQVMPRIGSHLPVTHLEAQERIARDGIVSASIGNDDDWQ